VRPGGCRDASNQCNRNQFTDFSKLTMLEIRDFSLFYFKTEIPKGKKAMVDRAFAVLI
jgi:hypothetical protein